MAKTIAFSFKLPNKKPDDKAKPETESMAEDKTEKDESDSEGYTKAELGKAVATAIKSGDGEAIFEAVKRLTDTTPTDAE